MVENTGYVASFDAKRTGGKRASPGARRARGGKGTSSRAADITARLTDPKSYSGSHKARFDPETGRGRGKAGRVDIVENDGYVGSYRQERSSGKVSKKVGSKASSVVDRLTDPKGYTGSHKKRFDPTTGKGRGKAGRVDVVENTGYVSSFDKSRKRGSPPRRRRQ